MKAIAARFTRFLDRLIDASCNPAQAGRTMLLLLAGYVAVWSLYGAIAKSSQDIHFDMGEAVVWWHEARAGNPKHPPLSGWLPGLWFSLFPRADWSYYLFTMVLAAVALWAAWKLSEKYLTPEKRVAGLALLTLVPFYNFHALKYNANTVLLPLWALTTWAFVRSYETRRVIPAALAGLAAAAAMLGKYWSAVLLAGLAIAVLADARRMIYLRSSAPWITAIVGFIALVPHLLWLYEHPTGFTYVLESHPGTIASALRTGLAYIGGAIAYAAVPLIIAAVVVRPTRRMLADVAWPPQPERRFVVVAFAAPLLLPLAAALVTTSNAVSLWGIGGMTLLPIVLLSSPDVTVPRAALRRILGIAIVFPLIALLASPIISAMIHRKGLDNHTAHYRLVAQAVEQEWRRVTAAPLRIVGSYNNLLFGSSFYFRDTPKTFEIVTPQVTPWTTEADIAQSGIAIVCPAGDMQCMTALDARAAKSPGARRSEVELVRRHFGIVGHPARYVILIVPPRL